MEKIIIEVGSNNTKIDLYNGKEVKHLKTEVIEFKKNYKKENKLDEKDINTLINIVKDYKKNYENIYVCGTSIFRNLTEEQNIEFLNRFYKETNLKFDIISQETKRTNSNWNN